MSNGAFLYEVSGVHEPSRALWTIVTIHVTTWCLPKLTMLWTDYAKLGVTSLVLGLAVVILITMDLTSSLYKELQIIVFAGTFRATSTKKMIIGDQHVVETIKDHKEAAITGTTIHKDFKDHKESNLNM